MIQDYHDSRMLPRPCTDATNTAISGGSNNSSDTKTSSGFMSPAQAVCSSLKSAFKINCNTHLSTRSDWYFFYDEQQLRQPRGRFLSRLLEKCDEFLENFVNYPSKNGITDDNNPYCSAVTILNLAIAISKATRRNQIITNPNIRVTEYANQKNRQKPTRNFRHLKNSNSNYAKKETQL